jgi:small subunit ribosomal protein S7
MPRKGPIPKREILPDPKYGNLKLAKFVNNLMERGKKKALQKKLFIQLLKKFQQEQKEIH